MVNEKKLQNLEVVVGELTNERRHYFYEMGDAPLFELFDAIYADIGWHLSRVVPEIVVPVVVKVRDGQAEYFLYDECLAGEYLFEKLDAEAVRNVADSLGQETLTGYYGCSMEEFDRHNDERPLIIELYHGSSGVRLAEIEEVDGKFMVRYVRADSNALAGAQDIIKALMQRQNE